MARAERLSHISRAANGGEICASVNDQCHGWTGVVPGNQYHVMTSPRVYAIYWDEYFKKNTPVVDTMEQFFQDILGGSYMRQLRQYGVGRGSFEGYTVIAPDSQNPPPAPPTRLTTHIEKQLKAWIDEGKVRARPAPDETNLLYVIFTPSTTSMGDCLCGLHQSGRYNNSSGDDNLFWAAIQGWHRYGVPAPATFADSCTWCVSHELVEAFTDRDGKGFRTADGCEIGDICECAKDSPIIKVMLDNKWWVETFWDNENQSCYPLHVVPQRTDPTGGYLDANGAANGGKQAANGGKQAANGGKQAGVSGGATSGKGEQMRSLED